MPIDSTATPLSAAARPELTGGRRIGVLLSHGFTGSPASMKPWGESLAAKGYALEVPCLPGHGTTWQAMNKTTWADWYAEVSRAFDKLNAENDHVVVGGLSMGGSLVLRIAADHPTDVDGIVLVNAAVVRPRKDELAVPLLRWVIPSMPGITNDIKKPDTLEYGYTRTPLRAAHSMMSSWKLLRADLAKVTAPILSFRSSVDHVVDPASARVIAAAVSSRDLTERMLENSYHVATLDNDAETIFEDSAEFIARVTAEP